MLIKQKPEDFKVKEILDLKIGKGDYSYYLMKKKEMNTLNAVRIISNKLKTKVGYAGLKDKNAITEQYISIFKGKEQSFKLNNIEVTYLGKGKVPIDTTLLLGNEFIITVREVKVPLKSVKSFPNYFDEQRFGIELKNHLVGKSIVKKDFLAACKLMNIDANKENCIAMLQKNIKLTKLCFSAYQSYIFNLALAEYIRNNSKFIEKEYPFGKLAFPLEDVKNITLPLLQFDTELNSDIREIYKKIMEKEGITKQDFLIRQLPNLITTTCYRDAIAEVKDFKIIIQDNTQILSFFLKKGSYATMLLKYAYTKLDSSALA